MIKPFQLFPSIAYKNSQFQLVSTVDDLEIAFYLGDECIRTEIIHSSYPTIITGLNSTGIIVAKCNLDGKEYCQEIEIRDAVRLGSSVFKKAFLFDGVDYSFLLMKDRLLLYDEKKHILYTENHISPTEIIHLSNSLFLFITRIGSTENGIVNLGIYSTNSFSIQGELVNDFKEIKILAESNNAWLLNSKSNTIHCFQLINDSKGCFEELITFEGFSDFLIDENTASLFLIFSEKILVIDLKNLHIIADIPKNDTNAIDKLGNIFTLVEKSLTWENGFEKFSRNFKLEFDLNLNAADFLHLGEALIAKKSPIDFNLIVDDMMVNNKIPLPFNKSYHTYQLPESEVIKDELITHQIFQNTVGLIISEHTKIRTLKEIKLDKKESEWHARPSVTHVSEYSIFSFESSIINYKLIDKSPSLRINNSYRSMLLVTSENKQKLFFGGTEINFPNDCEVQFFSIADNVYFLVKKESFYSLYSTKNIDSPLLENVKILNKNYFKEHQVIWYSPMNRTNSDSKLLNAFDLIKCTRIPVDSKHINPTTEVELQKSVFFKGYAKSYDDCIFNPNNFQIRSAVIGKVEGHSRNLTKILTINEDSFLFSKFDSKIHRFNVTQIPIVNQQYDESHLSPNGQFLVLQEKKNRYIYYDIDKNEQIGFINGNFLSFRNDGSLIIEDDKRSIRVLESETLQMINHQNYHYYRFISPDGKLYAQLSTKTRYTHRLREIEISVNEFKILKFSLDKPIHSDDKEIAKNRVERNRNELFEEYTEQCKKLKIHHPSQINTDAIVKVEKFIEIGIVGTDVKADIPVPNFLEYYNYAAFSYDNKYFSYVGKPSSNGLIHIYQIEFNELSNRIEIIDSYLSTLPKRASWVCGFSKNGYFATYDSIPDTYVIRVSDDFFKNKPIDFELRNTMNIKNNNLYHTYKDWNIIYGKNFLCFSPSGQFLALSEQGYDPLTLGGYGHQESNAVHIATTETGQVINSFIGHGDKIRVNQTKKVTFVAFSEDEKRLMTLSADGVVFIRDLSLDNKRI